MDDELQSAGGMAEIAILWPATGGGLDIEAFLAARTGVPPDRADEFAAWSPDELRSESHSVRRVLRRFAGAVADAVGDPDSTDRFLSELDLRAISRDHDWRAVFEAFREGPGQTSEAGRLLVIKYLQYLGSRLRLLEYVRANVHNLVETDDRSPPTVPLGRPGPDRFAGGGESDLVDLFLGEPVGLDLREGASVPVIMGGHRFWLADGDPPRLLDRIGGVGRLRRGRNLVGRHPASDLVVDGTYHRVSRTHLMLEWADDDTLTITDLSSRGTRVPRHATDIGFRIAD